MWSMVVVVAYTMYRTVHLEIFVVKYLHSLWQLCKFTCTYNYYESTCAPLMLTWYRVIALNTNYHNMKVS